MDTEMQRVVDLYSRALGDEVIAEVAVRRWTQAEITQAFGIRRGSFRKYFQTCETSPSVKTLHAVAAGLGITAIELLTRVEQRLERERQKPTTRGN